MFLPPESLDFSRERAVAISPDGQHVVVTLVDDTEASFLYIQKPDGSDGRRLPDTSGARGPFWSPHSNALGFFANGTLKTIRLNDLNATTLCKVPEGKDGSWNKLGVILFSLQSDGPLYRVADTGGRPAPATEIVPEDQTPNRPQPRYEVTHQWPHFLPDDEHFIYVSKSLDGENIAYLESLRSNERIRLFPNTESRVEYALPGYLLYVYQSTLIARPFDLKQLVPSNIYQDILPLKTNIGHNLEGDAIFSVSQTGLLAHWESQNALIWLDRNNQAEIFSQLPGEHDHPRFSPDGKWLAVSLRLESQDQSDIWVYSLERGTRSRVTNQGFNSHPIWSPNSQQIAFWSLRQNETGVFIKEPKNSAEDVLVFRREINSTQRALPRFWSSAGLAYTFRGTQDDYPSIFLITPNKSNQFLTPTQPTALTTASGAEVPRLSPDGHWLAYASHSQETTRSEVWVQSTMGENRRWMVSDSGGTVPVWSPDGRELFYRRSNSFELMFQSKNPLAKLMVVPVSTEQEFSSETPRTLLRRHGTNYDIAPDGNRFIQVHRQATALALTVNWKKHTSPTDDGDSVVPDISTIDVIR